MSMELTSEHFRKFLKSMTEEQIEKTWGNKSLVEIGKSIFGQFVQGRDHRKNLDKFAKLLLQCENYVFNRPFLRSWTFRGLSLVPFLIQAFIHYTSSIWKISDDFKVFHANFRSESQILQVLPLLLTQKFPEKVEFWKNSGIEHLEAGLHEDFMRLARKLAYEGIISFEAIVYSLTAEFLKPYRSKGYRLMCQALFMGLTDAGVIKRIITSRCDDEIRAGRIALHYVAYTSRSFDLFQLGLKGFFRNYKQPTNEDFQTFKRNIDDILSELHQEVPRQNNLKLEEMQKYVCEAIVQCYQKKIITKNQMTDVFCAALVQHPSICNTIVNALSHFDGPEAATWAMPCHSSMSMRSLAILGEDIASVYEQKGGHLRFPADGTVVVVDSDEMLNQLEVHFKLLGSAPTCYPYNLPVVGIDTEWSKYYRTTKANLLQIACPGSAPVVFLVDLDAFDDALLKRCYDIVFGPKYKVFKIGFQFRSDLVQLRRTAPRMECLYSPSDVLCIAQLISALSTKAPDVVKSAMCFTDAEFPSSHISEEYLRKCGLSKVSERFLGIRIDKSEQQSVWDRRPLRLSQQRYAALDALVLVRIFEKLHQLSTQHKFGILDLAGEICEAAAPFPFMLDDRFDPFKHPTVTAFDVFPREDCLNYY